MTAVPAPRGFTTARRAAARCSGWRGPAASPGDAARRRGPKAAAPPAGLPPVPAALLAAPSRAARPRAPAAPVRRADRLHQARGASTSGPADRTELPPAWSVQLIRSLKLRELSRSGADDAAERSAAARRRRARDSSAQRQALGPRPRRWSPDARRPAGARGSHARRWQEETAG